MCEKGKTTGGVRRGCRAVCQAMTELSSPLLGSGSHPCLSQKSLNGYSKKCWLTIPLESKGIKMEGNVYKYQESAVTATAQGRTATVYLLQSNR